MKKIALLIALVVSTFPAFGQNTGAPNAHLKGRNVVGTLPRPAYGVQESGTVVVTVWVDQYGNVTKALAGAEGTTVTSTELWTAARNAAMKTHFNQKANAPALQQGTITYIFTLDKAKTSTVRMNSEAPTLEEEPVDETALRFLGIPIDGSKEHMIAQLKDRGFEDHYGDYLEGQFNGEPVRVYVHEYHDRVDRIIVEFEHVAEMNINEQYNHLLSLLNTNEKYKHVDIYAPIPDEEKIDSEILLRNKDYKVRFRYVPKDTDESSEGEVWLSILNRRGYRVCIYYDNLKNRPHGEDL